ncbi:MAG: TetR/AcrR family transcriptional regulator [Gaiellaceae bacterium]
MTALRADAQRNLDRLLDAAAECFAERGVEASMDEIARRAGVGHGTVFRRFPTKEALLAAIVAKRAEELASAAVEALGDPDVGGAFTAFMRRLAELYARDRTLIDCLGRCGESAEVTVLVDVVRRLVRKAQRAGVVRRDVTADEVLALVPALSLSPEVILDGLRPPLR